MAEKTRKELRIEALEASIAFQNAAIAELKDSIKTRLKDIKDTKKENHELAKVVNSVDVLERQLASLKASQVVTPPATLAEIEETSQFVAKVRALSAADAVRKRAFEALDKLIEESNKLPSVA